MWLVLSEVNDAAAAWTAVGLRRLGFDPVVLLAADELVLGARLVHHVDSTGTVTTQLGLHDGRELHSRDIRGVVNRLTGPPMGAAAHLEPTDRPYAVEEWDAALASWLFSLPCPVLNPAGPGSLTGHWRRPARWRQLASGVGLGTKPWANAEHVAPPEPTELVTVLVAGPHVVGAPEPGLAEPLVQLAHAAGTPLIEVAFTDRLLALSDVSLLPYLPRYGNEGLEALAATLGATP